MSQRPNKRRAYDYDRAAAPQRPRPAPRRQPPARDGQRPRQPGAPPPRPAEGRPGGQRPRPRPDNGIPFPAQQAAQRSGQRPAAPPRRLRPTQPAQLARQQRRKHRRLTRAEMRRRRLARRLAAFVLLLGVIAAGAYLTVTMLFKINLIQLQLADGSVVEQAGGYTSQEILASLGVASGENIFSFDPDAKAAQLEQQYPLLEEIAVVRDYPNTVAVRVVEAVPTWTMQTGAGWLTLSARMKILDCTAAQPALPTLWGGEPVSAQPGAQLEYPALQPAGEDASAEAAAPTPDPRLDVLDALVTSLRQHSLLDGVTRIEFADTEQLAFLYEGRISVLLGTLNELEYKLDFAAYLLHNTDGKGCAATDTGRLDCSHVRSDGTIRPILAQGDPVLPSGYIAPAPQPEAAQPAAAEPAAGDAAEQAGSEAAPAAAPEAAAPAADAASAAPTA